jgi:hypothetical protein
MAGFLEGMFENGLKGNILGGLALGIGATIVAPLVVPVLASIAKPVAKGAIKGGIILFEKGKEMSAEVVESVEDLMAEVQSELKESRETAASKVAKGKADVTAT